MRKLFKSRKALSPVVAAIILIAVTVAVSIAVAAWMGALTFGMFGRAEELNILYVGCPSNTTMTVEVHNSGTSSITIKEVRVDGEKQTASVESGDLVPVAEGYSLDKGKSGIFELSLDFTLISGTKYEITAFTARGNIFGPYTKTAP